jgi:hypothetical protein
VRKGWRREGECPSDFRNCEKRRDADSCNGNSTNENKRPFVRQGSRLVVLNSCSTSVNVKPAGATQSVCIRRLVLLEYPRSLSTRNFLTNPHSHPNNNRNKINELASRHISGNKRL